jgi:hypothetical protein
MSFVVPYLPYFRQWLITCHWWPSSHSSLCLLKVCTEIRSLPLLPSLVCFQCPHLPPLLCVSFQFVFYSVFFWGGWGESVQGAVLVYPRGSWRNTVWHLMLTCLVCQMSPKQVWSRWWQPSCFLSVMWHGEAFYELGVQGIEVLILLGALFLQVWLQCLSKIFDSQSSHCLLLCPSHHLGSPPLRIF